MAVRNRIRRGLARFPWRGATGLALTLLVGGLFLWAAQLAWAVGKGKESVMADRPNPFGSLSPWTGPPDVKRLEREVESPPNSQIPTPKSQTETKRLKSELKSLRAENEQLMQAIQMLAEEIQWLHGEGPADANWPRDDAQPAGSDKATSKSNKIHPEFAAELFALEKELMDEIDAPLIEAELKRRLDEFRGALAESEAEARPQQKKSDPLAELASPHVSELKKFRQEYKDYITERLESLKAKRKMLLQQGTLTIEYATAMDTLIVDLMGRLLSLKKEAASRQEGKSNQSRPDYSTNFIPVPAPPASSIEEPAPQPTSDATATPATDDSRSGLDTGEFQIKITSEGKAATVSFYDPALDLNIHVETSLRTLPKLLKQLSKRNQSANNSPSVPGGAVPPYVDPQPGDFDQPFPDEGFSPPTEEPERKAKPTKPPAPLFKDPTAGVS